MSHQLVMGEDGAPIEGTRHLFNVKVHILCFTASMAMEKVNVFCHPNDESRTPIFCIRSVADD